MQTCGKGHFYIPGNRRYGLMERTIDIICRINKNA